MSDSCFIIKCGLSNNGIDNTFAKLYNYFRKELRGNKSTFQMLKTPYRSDQEIMRKQLSSIMKRRIRKQARKDVSKGLVKVVTITSAQGEHKLIMSPYISLQMRKFCTERDFYLGKSLQRFWTKNQNFRRQYHIHSFPRMIGSIDLQIDNYSGRIKTLTEYYGEQIAEQHNRQDEHEANGEEQHLVQLCINRAQKIRNQFYVETRDMYNSITELLSQKIDRLHAAEKALRFARSWCFLQIEYYCFCVFEFDGSIEPDWLHKEQTLQMVGDFDLLGSYQEVLELTVKKLAAYQADIDDIMRNSNKY